MLRSNKSAFKLRLPRVLLFHRPAIGSGIWPDPTAAQQMQSWSDRVAATSGDVFSEDEYLVLSNNKSVSRRRLHVQYSGRPRQMGSVVFVQSLQMRFGLVILQSGSTRFTPEASQALDASYTMKVQSSLLIDELKPVPCHPRSRSPVPIRNRRRCSLLGYALPPGVASSGAIRGEDLHVTLYWQAANKIAGDYATHVQLLNEAGEKSRRSGQPPHSFRQTTTDWQPRKPS